MSFSVDKSTIGLVLGIALIFGFGFIAIGSEDQPTEKKAVPSDFLPVDRISPLEAREQVPLSQFLNEKDWTVILLFRPTDCYPCMEYGAEVAQELGVNENEDLQITAIGIDTNQAEMQSFLRTVSLPYDVHIAPLRSESEQFYQYADQMGQTPLLILAEGYEVRYASQLVSDREAMQVKYDRLLSYIPSER